MKLSLIILLSFIGLAAIGFLISLYYRKRPVNIEKIKVNQTYLLVAFTAMLATLANLYIVENNIEFIQSIYGFPISPSSVVQELFFIIFTIPMVALFSIARWKKRELKKKKETEK